MFFISDAIKIYFCTRPTDMRMSFNGLYGVIKSFMDNDPMSGRLFVFRNRRGDKLKVMFWDRDGFVIWYKYIRKGTFRFPPVAAGTSMEIDYATMMMILEGIDLKSARRQKRYKFTGRVTPVNLVLPKSTCRPYPKNRISGSTSPEKPMKP
ncbi:MAG: IS66 family insertion sequence element accessory protein TnpB [Anaerolineae bacterium]|nr:IS66 family insertion sequence element accessory protein TnpB [Anaerolineae bacterium]